MGRPFTRPRPLRRKRDEATNVQQQNEIKALTASLGEQAAQIQKVCAQLAAASPSPGGLEASKFAIGQIRRGGPVPRVVDLERLDR